MSSSCSYFNRIFPHLRISGLAWNIIHKISYFCFFNIIYRMSSFTFYSVSCILIFWFKLWRYCTFYFIHLGCGAEVTVQWNNVGKRFVASSCEPKRRTCCREYKVSTQEQDSENDMMSPLEINDTEGGTSSENEDQPSRIHFVPVWNNVFYYSRYAAGGNQTVFLMWLRQK